MRKTKQPRPVARHGNKRPTNMAPLYVRVMPVLLLDRGADRFTGALYDGAVLVGIELRAF